MPNPSRAGLAARLVVSALLLTAVAAAWAADPAASRFYEDALARFEKKDYDGAILQLKNAQKIDAKMLPVHVLLGRALLARGELNAAEVSFAEALKLGVNPGEVLLPMAETFVAQGKHTALLSDARFASTALPPDIKPAVLLLKAGAASDIGDHREALKLVAEARALNTSSVDSWVAEVPIRVRARQFAEAKTAADKAVALDPKSPAAAYQQATVTHLSGDLKQAIAQYTRTLALKPSHINALVARAGLQMDLQRYEEARADVDAARKADPKDPRSAYLHALLVERSGSKEDVRKALTEVTNLFDPVPMDQLRYRPQVLMLGGLAHYGLQQFEKALPYLEMVIRQDANSPVNKLLANIYLRQNRTDKAVEALEQYLRARPDDRQAVSLLAAAQMSTGRYSRSAQLIEESLKGGDDPSMRAMLGISLVGAGKFAEGAAELEATLKKDPKQTRAAISLIALYLDSGQGAKAVALADKLVAQQPQNAGLLNLLGQAQVVDRNRKVARSTFERAAGLDANFVEPLVHLARLDLDEGALESALKRLNAVIAKDERHVDALLLVARVYEASGQSEEALKWLIRAEDKGGSNIRPGLQMVNFHLARGRPDLALQAVGRLQTKMPEALPVLTALARTQIAGNNLSEARSTLKRTGTAYSQDAAALVMVAELQVQAGDLAGAAYSLDKALQNKPGHLRGRAMRSSVALMQGDSGKAEQLAKSVVASDPKLALGYVLLGDVQRSRNQGAQALESFRKAHAIEPSSRSLLAVFSAMPGTQRAAAVALAEQWLKEHPNDIDVLRAVAESHASASDWSKARAAYESLIRLAPNDAIALNNLANVLVSMKDASALQVAERALKLKPEVSYIIGTTGWAAFHANQPDRALLLLRDARLRDPNNPSTRYFLGAVLARQGRGSEARTELQAAVQGGANFPYAREAGELLKTLQ